MAVLTGSAVLAFLSPYEDVLRIVGGTTLIALGVFGILKLRKKDADTQPELSEGRIYIQFFVLTSLNPFTIVYFMALITGNGSDWDFSRQEMVLFTWGAGLASLS